MTTRALPEIAMIPAHLRFASSGYRKASAEQNHEALKVAVKALHSTLAYAASEKMPESVTRALLLSVLSPMNTENTHPASIPAELADKADDIVEALSEAVVEPDTQALVSVLAQHNAQLVAA